MSAHAVGAHTRAVVTGAGSGLGAALCRLLVTRGARVVAADLDEAAARTTAAALGERVHAARCDVSDLAQVEALNAFADERLGGVDFVVNNAGVALAGDVGAVPIDDWRWIVGVNLWGVIHGCHVFVPRLRAQRRGAILNVASAAGLLSPPHMAPYNVSKAAVVALSETLYADLAADGVGVTVLCPTFFPTNIARAARGDERTRQLAQRLVDGGRWSADQIARAALDGVEAGALHVAPQLEARLLWRFKRMAPVSFQKLSGAIARRLLPR